MTSVLYGVLVPFALFIFVLAFAIYRRPNIRAGIKIPFAIFSFEVSDPKAQDCTQVSNIKKD